VSPLLYSLGVHGKRPAPISYQPLNTEHKLSSIERENELGSGQLRRLVWKSDVVSGGEGATLENMGAQGDAPEDTTTPPHRHATQTSHHKGPERQKARARARQRQRQGDRDRNLSRSKDCKNFEEAYRRAVFEGVRVGCWFDHKPWQHKFDILLQLF
jgi:hypothetical protein